MRTRARGSGCLTLFCPLARRLLNDEIHLTGLAVPNEIEPVLAADRSGGDEIAQMPAVHHIPPVEPLDDISPFEAGLLRGPLRLEVGDDRTLHVRQAKDFPEKRRDVLRGRA